MHVWTTHTKAMSMWYIYILLSLYIIIIHLFEDIYFWTWVNPGIEQQHPKNVLQVVPVWPIWQRERERVRGGREEGREGEWFNMIYIITYSPWEAPTTTSNEQVAGAHRVVTVELHASQIQAPCRGFSDLGIGISPPSRERRGWTGCLNSIYNDPVNFKSQTFLSAGLGFHTNTI